MKAPARPARVKDVAQLAGVSVSAVSRYLNAGLVLPEATAARIDAAVRQLGYRPNRLARSLSLGRSETIGLVVPEIANPFFAHLAAAVEEAAEQAGLGLLLCATLNRPGRELEYIDRLRHQEVDGLLFLTNHADDGTLAQKINGLPGIVLIDEDVAGTTGPKIFCDNRMGGEMAGRHLLEAGHRRIGFVGGPEGLMSTTERLEGLRAVPGVEVSWTSTGSYLPEHGRAAAAAWLALPLRPSAVFLGSGTLLEGFLEGLQGSGIAVPRDLSLVAFDDIGPLHLFSPPITAIRQPVTELGRRGVALIQSRLRGGEIKPETLRLPVELVARGSVARPAPVAATRQRTRTAAAVSKGRVAQA